MRLFRDTITLQTGQSQEFIDITKHVRDVIARSRSGTGWWWSTPCTPRSGCS